MDLYVPTDIMELNIEETQPESFIGDDDITETPLALLHINSQPELSEEDTIIVQSIERDEVDNVSQDSLQVKSQSEVMLLKGY